MWSWQQQKKIPRMVAVCIRIKSTASTSATAVAVRNDSSTRISIHLNGIRHGRWHEDIGSFRGGAIRRGALPGWAECFIARTKKANGHFYINSFFCSRKHLTSVLGFSAPIKNGLHFVFGIPEIIHARIIVIAADTYRSRSLSTSCIKWVR